MTPSRDFHPDDPRSRTRVALDAGEVAIAQVWAELATAEAIHRLAKTVGREFDRPSAPTPIERGRTRSPAELLEAVHRSPPPDEAA